MENYIVSARKYRPSTFDSVVGQTALTTTLKNAIRSGKLAHAYLFCGPRGVGKTTCARIFAKTINCMSPRDNGEACGECESCRAFAEQRSFNIHELDAASNNSVDDIRQLIDQVRVLPQVGRYKIFIIDEVHMLSPAAFNAFLKTLEEPPAHAIFILATTEKHKILPTILSRCQIYDFNRMEVNDIVEHLKKVAQQENISYEEEALGVIAQKADGGMRDALSIFDQVASFTSGNIEYTKVIENLNVLDYEYYFKITDACLEHNVPQLMLTLNEILNKGFEGSHFIGGLASHFRDLLVSRDEVTLQLLEVAGRVKDKYREQAGKTNVKFLYRALKLCSDCSINYKASQNKRLLLEITLIEIAQLTEDDEGSGLRPTKKIKPIFQHTQQEAKPIASAQKQPSQAAPTPSVQTSDSAIVTEATPYQSKATTATTTPHLRTLKTLGTPSIKLGQKQREQKEETETEKKAETAIPTIAEADMEPIDWEKLQFYWHKFANSLPRELNALAGRMKDPKLTLRITSNTEIKLLVANEEVQTMFLYHKQQIEEYLRTGLKNTFLKMIVDIIPPEERPRFLTLREQFAELVKNNRSIATLQKELGLELS